jgi:hypothetical protein
MGVPTSNLQDFFEIQMQLNNDKKILKIRTYFNKSITKYESPNTKQPNSSLFLDQIECFM